MRPVQPPGADRRRAPVSSQALSAVAPTGAPRPSTVPEARASLRLRRPARVHEEEWEDRGWQQGWCRPGACEPATAEVHDSDRRALLHDRRTLRTQTLAAGHGISKSRSSEQRRAVRALRARRVGDQTRRRPTRSARAGSAPRGARQGVWVGPGLVHTRPLAARRHHRRWHWYAKFTLTDFGATPQGTRSP